MITVNTHVLNAMFKLTGMSFSAIVSIVCFRVIGDVGSFEMFSKASLTFHTVVINIDVHMSEYCVRSAITV